METRGALYYIPGFLGHSLPRYAGPPRGSETTTPRIHTPFPQASSASTVQATMTTKIDLVLATTANDLPAVPQLVEDVSKLAKTLEGGGDAARHALLLKARTLVQALETPRETMIKHTWAQVRHNR